jgi:hypothetical protein
MHRARLITICIVIVGLAAGATAAFASTDTAQRGNVKAILTVKGQRPFFKLHLKIIRAGKVAFDGPVTSKLESAPFGPIDFPPRSAPVQVRDLQPGTPPAVVLSLIGAGAHCCFIEQVYTFDGATGTYVKTEKDFGNASVAVERLRGHWRFVSADNSFYYEFAPFAGSGAPIQIWRFENGRFADVTRAYPKPVENDAGMWLNAFEQNWRYGGNGLIAAWAADEDLLGHYLYVKHVLAHQLELHHLGSPRGWPSGKHFIAALQAFLRQQGYRP